MKRALTALAAGVLVLTATPAAHAIPDAPTEAVVMMFAPDVATGPPAVAAGATCGMLSSTDPLAPGLQIAAIAAGPLATAASTLASIEVRCTVQTGAANWAHGGANACSVVSTVQTQVATLPPSVGLPTCAYPLATPSTPVYLCTEVKVNGLTRYWSPSSGWSSSAAVACASPDVVLPIGPILQPIVDLLAALTAPFDPLICPLLASLSPGVPGYLDIDPTGDTYVLGHRVWNCPPY